MHEHQRRPGAGDMARDQRAVRRFDALDLIGHGRTISSARSAFKHCVTTADQDRDPADDRRRRALLFQRGGSTRSDFADGYRRRVAAGFLGRARQVAQCHVGEAIGVEVERRGVIRSQALDQVFRGESAKFDSSR